MVRRARQRHGQADVIRAGERVVQRGHRQQLIDGDAGVVARRRIVLQRHQPDAERAGARRQRLADPTQPDDQHRLARQLAGSVGARRGVAFPAPPELGPEQRRQPAREHQHHRHQVLGDVRPVHAAGAGDRDAAGEQRRRGDRVQPGRHRAEPAQPARARQLCVRQILRDDHVHLRKRASEVVARRERQDDPPAEAR
jgi:hypothetical protein